MEEMTWEATVDNPQPPQPPKKVRNRRAGQKEEKRKKDLTTDAALPDSSPKIITEAQAAKKVKKQERALKKAAQFEAAKLNLPWISLTSTIKKQAVCYSADGLLFFVAAGSAIMVYDAAATPLRLLSMLNIPHDYKLHAQSESRQVTCAVINPQNKSQLIVGSLDGVLRFWDFENGRLVRSVIVRAPVTRIAANSASLNHVFVATTCSVKNPMESRSIVYRVSLGKDDDPPIRKLLSTKTAVFDVKLTKDARFVIAVTSAQLYIMLADDPNSGWVRSSPPDPLSCIALHPTEPCLATGDERGTVRLYYCFEDDWWERRAKLQAQTGNKHPLNGPRSSAVFHWHAHAVQGLDFTPNGAYMMSAGYEGVLVFWQISTGAKDFLPRLGGPISGLLTAPPGDREQEVAITLSDGSTLFATTQTYKVRATIASIKQDAAKTPHPKFAAKEPLTVIRSGKKKIAVLQSSHPSSLQFYSIDDDKHLFELEVTPSNRIAPRRGAEESHLQPCRVAKLAISESIDSLNPGVRWMATYDVWQSPGYEAESYLRFWHIDVDKKRHILLSTVSRPHQSKLTAAIFRPSQSNSEHALLTTGQDGSIKLWACEKAKTPKLSLVWRCLSEIRLRDLPVHSAALSIDGSLLATAHGTQVSLWDAASLTLVRNLPLAGIDTANEVAFAGLEGGTLVVRCYEQIIGWNIATFEGVFILNLQNKKCLKKECLRLDTRASSLVQHLSLSATMHILASEGSSDGRLISIARESETSTKISAKPMPPIAAAVSLHEAENPVLLARLESGQVILTGERVAETVVKPQFVALPISTAAPGSFRDIFGASLTADVTSSARREAASAKSNAADPTDVFNSPAHLLPSMSKLWRDLIALPPRGAEKASTLDSDPSRMDVDTGIAVASVQEPAIQALTARFSLHDLLSA